MISAVVAVSSMRHRSKSNFAFRVFIVKVDSTTGSFEIGSNSAV